MTVADDIIGVFARRGAGAYFGESVTMTQHALQAAHFASAAAAPDALVIAALLHDIGHLVVDVPDDLRDWVADGRHERVGGTWLAERFPAQVSEPVRLHVPAKRYLCATDSHYFSRLSPASVVTLGLQGGPMAADEVARFETEPFHEEAVMIRQWDDRGKIAGLVTLPVEEYRSAIDQLARRAP